MLVDDDILLAESADKMQQPEGLDKNEEGGPELSPEGQMIKLNYIGGGALASR